MEAPSGLLENCISPTGIIRQQLPEAERAALEILDRLEAQGKVKLYTSQTVKPEIDRTPRHDTRERLETLYELYTRLPLVEEEFRMPPMIRSNRAGLTGGPIVKDELLGRLSFLPHEPDRQHVYQASKSGLQYFVTRDRSSVLDFAIRIRDEADVIACLPSQLAADFDAAKS